MAARTSTVDAAYASRAHNILTILIGANDGGDVVATLEANLQVYVQARQATGWTVLVCTAIF